MKDKRYRAKLVKRVYIPKSNGKMRSLGIPGIISGDIECYLKGLLERIKLTLNADQTRKIQAKENSFDFLGFTFRYDKDLYGYNKRYWNVEPSKKSLRKIKEKVKTYIKKTDLKIRNF